MTPGGGHPFASVAVRHPRLVSAGIVLVTALLASAIPRLSIDTSAEGFMVSGDSARTIYDEFKRQFGTDNATLVVIKADDVFRPEVLAAVRRLSDALEQVPGVMRVESLATARRVVADDDTLENRLLLDAEIPTDAAALATIRERATSHRVLVGNIVAADAGATAILVYTDAPEGESDFNRRFVEQVDALIAAERQAGIEAYQVGRPLLKDTYSQYILRDLQRLIPISTAVLLATLLLLFRSADAVLVPLTTVGVSIVWSFGLMALTGIPLNVVTAVIPSLLVTIGFTEDVHIISDYHRRVREGMDRRTAVATAMEATAIPILVTTITTVVGFASLGLADVTMLAQFGYASAMALVGNYVVTMALLPVVVLAMPAYRGAPIDRRWGDRLIGEGLERLGWFNVRHRTTIIAASAVLLVGAAVPLSRIDVNTDFISYFPENDPIRQRARDVHEVLTGAEAFWIVVDTQRPDGIKEPAVLARISGLQEFLAGTGLVDKSVSIADYLMLINRDLRGGGAADERLPDSREAVAQYMLMLQSRDLASLVNADSSAAAVIVRHNLTGSARMNELERLMDGRFAEAFGRDVSVSYTGESILTNNAADYMAVNELTSFGFTFAAIAIIHAVLFMSVPIGLLSLVPNLIPIVAAYGLMAALGVPLNTGTALVATVAIGIAVDDTVHHLTTYARELTVLPNPSLAMFATLRDVGRPIITASFALAAGFLVVTASSFTPLRQFGLYAAITMLLALATELMITPALMMTVRVVTVWDLLIMKLDPKLIAASPLFRGLSPWEVRKVLLLGGLRHFTSGAFVARRGEVSGGLYLVVRGRLRLDATVDEAEVAAGELEEGAVFGELADGTSTWSADVIAEESSELLLLDEASLERLRRRFPSTAGKLFRNLAVMLSTRLRVFEALARDKLTAGPP